MKHLKLVGGLLMMAAILVTGCDDESLLGGDGANNTITAKVNGGSWQNSSLSATRVNPPGAISIVGVGNSEQIALQISPTGVGSYPLTGAQQWASYTKLGTQYSTKQEGGSGSVTITKYDETSRLISGTFSFVARDFSGTPVNITEGSFVNVKWSEQ